MVQTEPSRIALRRFPYIPFTSMSRFALCWLCLCSSCVVAEGTRPRVTYGLELASEDNHRGMVQNETGVLRPSLAVALPAKKEGNIVVIGDGSIDLANDTGDAWLPDGHGGRFSRLDWKLLYEQRLDNVLMTYGVVNYNLPNGLEFPFGERGATTELLLETFVDIDGLQPGFALNYDVDEVDGLYVNAFVGKSFIFDEDWSLRTDLGLGWMDEKQAAWNYAQAPKHSGLADLRLSGEARYRIDEHTSATALLAYSEVIDGEYRDWIDTLGIETTRLWLGLGIEWSY